MSHSNSALKELRGDGVKVVNEKDFRKDDIVIAIMGQTGAGKSTFVNNVIGSHVADTNDTYQSCTQQLAPYFWTIPNKLKDAYGITEPNRRAVLVDTPGFDDTEVTDSEILRRIAVWLAESYELGMKVAGVVYVHPIFPGRMTRNDCSNVRVFRKICGDAGLTKVILATTRWDICPEETGDNREKELVDNFWTNLLRNPQAAQEKAKIRRLHNSKESALEIVSAILERIAQTKIDGVILKLQDQIVKKGKRFQQTGAAMELRKKLVDLLKESGSSSSQSRRERLRSLAQQVSELKIPLGARIKMMLGLA